MTSPRHEQEDAISTRLADFYGEHRISVCGFRCKHAEACASAAGNSELNRGSEAHVGSNYGQRHRVVVVSLDTGGTSDGLAARRQRVEETAPGNQHMHGTLQLLRAVYGDEAFDGNEKNHLFTLFAMTNAAKCSGGVFGGGQVGWELFRNCREYVMPELECLDPELIVTQGVRAFEAINDHGEGLALSEAHQAVVEQHTVDLPKEVRGWISALAEEYFRTVAVGRNEVPVMKTVHPSARGGQWQYFTRIALGPVAWLARCLMDAQTAKTPGPGQSRFRSCDKVNR